MRGPADQTPPWDPPWHAATGATVETAGAALPSSAVVSGPAAADLAAPASPLAAASRLGEAPDSWADRPVSVYLSNTDPGLRRCWHPVAFGREVGTAPRPVQLLGETWTVVRSSSDGRPIARRHHDGAAPAGVVDHNGLVFLAPDDPVTELLPVDEAHDPAFRMGWLTPLRARVGAGLMTDNFLDMAHFPFVHAATIGIDDATDLRDLRVEHHSEGEGDGHDQRLGMTVSAEHPFAHHEDPGVAAGIRPLQQRRRVTYIYRAPFAVCLRIEYLDAGGTNTIAFAVQPEDEDSCRLYAAVYRDDLGDDPVVAERRLAEAVRYEESIVREDLALQTQYVDLRLPLDLRIEVHIPADRPTVELRRILRQLVEAGR